MYPDYESWGVASITPDLPPDLPVQPRHFIREESVMEAYSGVQIVAWYGTIERQLEEMIEKAEANRNFPYADNLRQFLKTWRDNEITGSINRETLDVLKAAASQLAVNTWKHSNYFSNLRDSIRKLVASEEELPREMPKPAGGGGPGGGAPKISPPPTDFGPSDEAGAPTGEEDLSADAGETAMDDNTANAVSAGGRSNV